MKKIFFIILLLTANTCAAEEWMLIAENDNTAHYIDPSRFVKNGEKIKIWTMYDTTNKAGLAGYPSIKSGISQTEYNCKEVKSRSIYEVAYSGSMGSSSVLNVYPDETKFNPIVPGSIDETIFKFACNKN